MVSSRKKISLMLIIMLFINNIITITVEADANNKVVQKFANVVLFVDFADSTSNFMDGRREEILGRYDGNNNKALTNYISTISNGKMSVVNYFPQDNGNKIVTYRLSKNRSYYNSQSREYEMIIEVVQNTSINSNINLDMNNDGEVDNVSFVFEGGSPNRSDTFWPHKSNHNNGSKINGKWVNIYNLHNEESILNDTIFGAEGVIAHEFLHSIGYPDLYRSDGIGQPVGDWDIMAKKSVFLQYPLAYMRRDWVSLDTVTQSGTYKLNPATSTEGSQAIILKTPLSEKEFFVIEYRKKGNSLKGEFEGKIPGSGIIIYRVNTDVNTNFLGAPDYIYVFRPGEIREADGKGNIMESFLSKESGRTTYGTEDLSAKITDKAITYSSGMNSGLVIKNVSNAGDTISFDIKFPDLSNIGIWDTVGNQAVTNNFSNQFSMDVVGKEIYTTYTEGGLRKKLKASKFDGENWVNLGGDITTSEAYDSKIQVYNGTPYSIYHNAEYKLVAAKYENGSWSNIQTISNNLSQSSEMVATKNGLYIAYTEPDSSKLKVAKLNSSGSKFEQVGGDIDNGYIHGIGITEENGTIYVSYTAFDEGNKVHVKKYNGVWSEVGALDVVGVTTNIIACEGKLYIVKGATDGSESIQVYEFKENRWNKLGSDISGKEGIIKVYEGKPYVACINDSTKEVYVKSFDGTDWVSEGVRVTDKDASSMKFDIENGSAFVGYFDKDGNVEVKSKKISGNLVVSEDVNKDGVVDIQDLSIVASQYNKTNKEDSWNNDLDINKDGIIDIFDLVSVAKKI